MSFQYELTAKPAFLEAMGEKPYTGLQNVLEATEYEIKDDIEDLRRLARLDKRTQESFEGTIHKRNVSDTRQADQDLQNMGSD